MLLHNWVVKKVPFGFVKMGFAPLYLREISLGPSSDRMKKCMAVLGLSVNQGFQITVSRKRGQLRARPNIARQREQYVYQIVMARQMRSLHAHRS